MTLLLHDFWRSSSAYRVRIALNLKGLAYTSAEVSLPAGTHQSEAFRATNPQGLIPAIETGGITIPQSLAIIDWLDARHPEPRLIPAGIEARAHELALAMIVIAEIQPINNLRVLKYLKDTLGHSQDKIDAWIQHWICEGFAALEAKAAPDFPYLSGAAPGLADICLVPQMYNARRFNTPLEAFPKLVQIDATCATLLAFQRAHPDAVKGD